MLFGKSRVELKVGIFVFIALLILVFFVLAIGDFKNWAVGYQVNFIFNFVNGVKLGAPVRFSGVDVGEVKEINLYLDAKEAKTKVCIVCWIRKDIGIPVDSTVWVNTLGLLGEKYIEVIPGKDYTKFLAPGSSLAGKDPVPMHEITELAKRIADDLDESISKIKNKEGTIGKLLYDNKIYNELEALIMDVRKHPWKLFIKTKEKPEKK